MLTSSGEGCRRLSNLSRALVDGGFEKTGNAIVETKQNPSLSGKVGRQTGRHNVLNKDATLLAVLQMLSEVVNMDEYAHGLSSLRATGKLMINARAQKG